MAARVVLIDGSAMVFRAYYAIPANLTTSFGLHTNAIFGFTNMFRKLLSGKTPDYAAVIFDPPGGSFRNQKFADYKANRSGAEDDLIEQLPWIDRVVEAYQFARLQVKGFEADDVIGTLTRQAVEAGHEVLIVSGDKDFAQLINDQVKMVDAIRDVTYDPELVRKKWGVVPSQFIDFLAMVGDKIDNIPGIPGIGPKGASSLLEQYSDLETVLANAEQVPGKNGKLLMQYQEQARLSRELATIDTRVELGTGLEELRYRPPDQEQLNALYRELEFFSLLSEGARDEQAREAEGDTEYRLLDSCAEVEAFLAGLPGTAALQVLYDLPSPVFGAWVGTAVSGRAAQAAYIPWRADLEAPLRAFLEAEDRPKVVHELRPLYILCRRHGIKLSAIHSETRLASFLIDPTRLIPHDLDSVVKDYLHRTIRPLKSLTGSGQSTLSLSQVPVAQACDYACHLADAIGQLWPRLDSRVDEEGQRAQYTERELPLAFVLAEMEYAGVKVDPDDLQAMGVEFRERLATFEHEIYTLAGREFNIGSTKQLGQVLFDELKLPIVKRTKTGYSTDAEVLEKLAARHDIARHLLEHRKLAKLINTYTDVLAKAMNEHTGRIHATFQQTSGATGRIISAEPDLQRTPVRTPEGQRIRRAFCVDAGNRMISADWSQIELRVLAHVCGDPLLVEAFQKNLDVHRRTASQLFGCALEEVSREQREIAKTVNFATIYGQGATALAQILGIARKDAQHYIDEYFRAYATVRTWLDDTIAAAHRDGYVTTLFGRRRYIPELSSRNFIDRQAGERIAANTPIQGTAADLCKLAMLNIAREIESRSLATRMLLQIHDELVFECPVAEVEPAVELVKRHMEQVFPLNVPLVVNLGVGHNWAEAHETPAPIPGQAPTTG